MRIIQKLDSPAEVLCNDLDLLFNSGKSAGSLQDGFKICGTRTVVFCLHASDDSQFQFLHAPFSSIILYLSYHPAARRAIPECSALLRLSLREDDLEDKEGDHHGHPPLTCGNSSLCFVTDWSAQDY